MAHPHQKSRRKKQYRPRPVSLAGGLAVIDKHHAVAELRQPIPDEHATDLGIAYWFAFNQMLTGESSEETWCTVVCSLNIALVLAERGVGREFVPYLVKALDGAFRANLRAQRTGSWRFDGDAINAIRQALEIHDEQVKAVSKAEMVAALTEVRRRVDDGLVYQAAAA